MKVQIEFPTEEKETKSTPSIKEWVLSKTVYFIVGSFLLMCISVFMAYTANQKVKKRDSFYQAEKDLNALRGARPEQLKSFHDKLHNNPSYYGAPYQSVLLQKCLEFGDIEMFNSLLHSEQTIDWGLGKESEFTKATVLIEGKEYEKALDLSLALQVSLEKEPLAGTFINHKALLFFNQLRVYMLARKLEKVELENKYQSFLHTASENDVEFKPFL